MTIKRVYYDIEESVYICNLDGLSYYFTSEFNRDRFVASIKENREFYEKSLFKRFGISIDTNLLSDLKTYERVEKRGFLIKKGGNIVWRESPKLGIVPKINKN